MSEPNAKPLQQIVDEVGQYPIDAYIFVQECVGVAAERVHGALTPEQATMAHWMLKNKIGPDQLVWLSQAGQLPKEIAQSLELSGGVEQMNRHISGQQLCRVIRDVALERWGLMARPVLARWNIHRTEDIGVIIFALVNSDLLQKQPSDCIEDFDSVFDFDEAFDHSYQIGAS